MVHLHGMWEMQELVGRPACKAWPCARSALLQPCGTTAIHGICPKLEFSWKTRNCPLLEAGFLTQVDMCEHLRPRQGPFRGLATSNARLLHVAARDSLESAR